MPYAAMHAAKSILQLYDFRVEKLSDTVLCVSLETGQVVDDAVNCLQKHHIICKSVCKQ